MDELSERLENVYLTASKSRKLTTGLVGTYTSVVLRPYIESKPFLLILDSWSGQSQSHLFDKFKNESGDSTCTIKYIPPGCTAYCQPLDTYLHRQIKDLLKKFYNSTYLLQEGRQINTRNDAVKLYSLIKSSFSKIISSILQFLGM